MGLFSSKYVTRVSATVSRAIADDRLPNAVKTGTIKSLLRNEDQSDHILEELVSGLALKANRMYRYGGASYTHGLPSGEILTSNQGQAAVTAVLTALEGATVILDYNHFGPANSLHIAWMKLIADYGYNPATNQLGVLTASEGTPVYLHDMVVRIPADTLALLEPGARAQWGVSPKAGQSPTRPAWTADYLWMTKHSPLEVPAGTGDPFAIAYWVKTVPGTLGSLPLASTPVAITIPLTGYDDDADYFHVKYSVGGVVKYFMYEVGAGTYPTLDTFFDTEPELLGEFFPFAHFRYAKASTNTNKTSPAYLTSKKLVKYLGMDFDQVADGIAENPDIADVEQAMLVMAVPAVTSVEIEQRYLYEFFRKMYMTAPETYTSNAMQILQSRGEPVRTSMVIQDKLFKFSLSNAGIVRQMVAGTLGPVGTHHTASGPITYSVQVYGQFGGDTGDGSWSYETNTRNAYYYAYRKQVTAFAYEEIRVLDLTMRYHMDSRYEVVGDEADNLLLIPLDSIIAKTMSLPDRELLYARSMQFVFTSRVITKVRWYQQAWFGTLLKIVGFALALFSGGGAAFLANLAAGVLSVTTIVMTVITALIEYLITSFIIQLFVKAVGGDAALIFAVIFAVAAGVDAIRSGSLQGAPWAKDLLNLASGLTKGISEFVKDGFIDLQKEVNTFVDYMKEVNDDLNAAKRLLEGNNRLDPLLLWGESPGQYFQRTVHSGNIGVLSISAVSNYVSNSLKLPELSHTLGEDF